MSVVIDRKWSQLHLQSPRSIYRRSKYSLHHNFAVGASQSHGNKVSEMQETIFADSTINVVVFSSCSAKKGSALLV